MYAPLAYVRFHTYTNTQAEDAIDVCDAKDGTHLAINDKLPDGLVVVVNKHQVQ